MNTTCEIDLREASAPEAVQAANDDAPVCQPHAHFPAHHCIGVVQEKRLLPPPRLD